MRRRVVVTGIGCVTPLGADVETMWRRLRAGESGVDYISLFDASEFPTKIAAEVRNWDISQAGEKPEDWKFQGRHTHFAVGAAKQAMADAGLDCGRRTRQDAASTSRPASASTPAAARGSRTSTASPT